MGRNFRKRERIDSSLTEPADLPQESLEDVDNSWSVRMLVRDDASRQIA